jgi:hypothetical protein
LEPAGVTLLLLLNRDSTASRWPVGILWNGLEREEQEVTVV